ncbi:MAG TPA: phosphoribosyltransferase family protein [Gemmatimonadales bacterium]|nr:phosphoribosyltransferase family protein [Gemmatimonadales bacterium]
MPRWSELRATLERAERWLLPGSCLICGETVRARRTGFPQGALGAAERVAREARCCRVAPSAPEGNPAQAPPDHDPLLCAPCTNRFAPLPYPQCRSCGQPLAPGIPCRLCAEWPKAFGGVESAVWLDDTARRAIHLLKYEGWRRLAEPLADTMAKRITALGTERLAAGPPDHLTLVPIPLSAARYRHRGYNQSAVLAEALGERLGVPVAEALRRRRDTATQTALTPEARRANLAGAFEAPGRPPRHAVLVDDVFTTGATLAEAAAALLEAGARTVTGVTFARAVRPLADATGTLSSR